MKAVECGFPLHGFSIAWHPVSSLGIGNYSLQVFLPKPKIEINFLVFPTDAGGACVAVSYVN